MTAAEDNHNNHNNHRRFRKMKNYTHICVVLDASGSMAAIEDDTKGSFNSFIKAQSKAEGKTVFDLFQFSDKTKRIVEHADLAALDEDLMAKYECSGRTALNDAVCTAIDTLGREFAAMAEDERPDNVVFAIITDGMENASREFNGDDVRKRIKEQSETYKWNFQFLAANQDAFASGGRLGLDKKCCADFVADRDGMKTMCAMLCQCVDNVRALKKTSAKTRP